MRESKMKHDSDLSPVDQISQDTFRLAEKMCAQLSSTLTLDKRDRAVFYSGAFTDLGLPTRREFKVTVADLADQPWLTLIADAVLPVTERGLLVYKVRPDQDRRYLGRLHLCRTGKRQDDHAERFFAVFDIVRDARR